MSRTVARAADALLWGTAILGVAAVAATALMWLTGTRPVVVQSGSMEPAYPIRSVALIHRVDAADVEEGDVLALTLAGGQRVLHRVTSVEPAPAGVSVGTKGDANETADARPVTLPHGEAAWRAGAVVPHAGAVAAILRTPAAGFALGLALLGPIALGRGRRPAQPAEPALA